MRTAVRWFAELCVRGRRKHGRLFVFVRLRYIESKLLWSPKHTSPLWNFYQILTRLSNQEYPKLFLPMFFLSTEVVYLSIIITCSVHPLHFWRKKTLILCWDFPLLPTNFPLLTKNFLLLPKNFLHLHKNFHSYKKNVLLLPRNIPNYLKNFPILPKKNYLSIPSLVIFWQFLFPILWEIKGRIRSCGFLHIFPVAILLFPSSAWGYNPSGTIS